MIDRRHLGAYLDEVSEDPEAACESLAARNIRLVALRRAWTQGLESLQDQALHRLKSSLDDHGLKAAMVVSNVGAVDQSELAGVPGDEVQRPFLLANYFGASAVRVHAGFGTGRPDLQLLSAWMSRVTKRSIAANVTPLLELSAEGVLQEPGDVAALLRDHPRWGLLYDPAGLMVTRVLDPYTKYWTLLKSRVAAIDLRDVLPGRKYLPVGHGSCRWADTLADATASGYRGHYFLEPGLGRRYGDALTREGAFEIAYEAIKPFF